MVNYDDFLIDAAVADTYAAMVRYMETHYYTTASRYTTSAFLRSQAPPIEGWSDLPVWLPAEGETAGFSQRSIARALDKGLTFRPFADTVRETLAFYEQQPEDRKVKLRAGISAERETQALAAWKARGPGSQ